MSGLSVSIILLSVLVRSVASDIVLQIYTVYGQELSGQ